MKIDGFLKVPDIPGPSVRDGHEDEIEVHGVYFTMDAPRDPTSLSRRGRVVFDTIVFDTYYDMSSPHLKKALFQNTLFSEVKFAARRTIEGETSDYLVITLSDASVVSYELGPGTEPGTESLIEEQIGFAYRSIKFNYDDTHEVEMDVHVGR